MFDSMKFEHIRVEKLGVQLTSKRVLNDLSVELSHAKWVSVIGANGAGKSTFLKALAALIAFEGRVEFNGVDLTRLAPMQRARTVSWMGQSESRQSSLKVRDVVMLSRMPHQAQSQSNPAKDEVVVAWALDCLGLQHLQDQVFVRISAGEQQRVLIARALAVKAPLLLLDEPFAFLDPPHQAELVKTIQDQVKAGHAVITVIHDLTLALQSDWIFLLDQGRLVYEGSSGDAATHQAIEQAFQYRVKVLQTEEGWICRVR
jgi:iron complex transport system ATP-binding protein